MSIVISSNKTYNNPNIKISADNKISGVNSSSYYMSITEEQEGNITLQRTEYSKKFKEAKLFSPKGLGHAANYVWSETNQFDRFDFLYTTITLNLNYDYIDGGGNKPYEHLKDANIENISATVEQIGTKNFYDTGTPSNVRSIYLTSEERAALNDKDNRYIDRFSVNLQKQKDILPDSDVTNNSSQMKYSDAVKEIQKLYTGSPDVFIGIGDVKKYENYISIPVSVMTSATYVNGYWPPNWPGNTVLDDIKYCRKITNYEFTEAIINIKFIYQYVEKNDNSHFIGDSVSNTETIDESFIFYEGNYINQGIDIYSYNSNEIIAEYKNGKQIISMDVPISNYFDEDGDVCYIDKDNNLLIEKGNHIVNNRGEIVYTLSDIFNSTGIENVTPEVSSNVIKKIYGNDDIMLALKENKQTNYYMSNDCGENWSLYNYPSTIQNAFVQMCYGNGIFTGLFSKAEDMYFANSYNGIDWNIKYFYFRDDLIWENVTTPIDVVDSTIGGGDNYYGLYIIDRSGDLYFSSSYSPVGAIQLLRISYNFEANSIKTGFTSGSSGIYRFVVVGNYGKAYYADTRKPISYSSWKSVTTNTSYNLNCVYPIVYGFSILNFVIVGDNGTILSLYDRNNTTTNVTSPTTENLNYIDEKVIVGDNGTILYQTNTNPTYVLVESPTTENLNCVSKKQSKNQYLAVGDNGTVLFSTDGTNWELIETDTTENLNTISGDLIFGDNETVLEFIPSTKKTRILNSPNLPSGDENILYSMTNNQITYVFSKLRTYAADTEVVDNQVLHYANNNFHFFSGNNVYISKDGLNYDKYLCNVYGGVETIGYMNGKYIGRIRGDYYNSSNSTISLYLSEDLQNWTKRTISISSAFIPDTYDGSIYVRRQIEILNDNIFIYGTITEGGVGGIVAVAYSSDFNGFNIIKIGDVFDSSLVVAGNYNQGYYYLFYEDGGNANSKSLNIYMSKDLKEFDFVYMTSAKRFTDVINSYNDIVLLTDKSNIMKISGFSDYKTIFNLIDRFALSRGMICLPKYTYNGKDIPLVSDKSGNGKRFKIISSTVNYNGNIIDSITMEEYIQGNNESIKYLTFDYSTNTITNLTIPSDVDKIELDIPFSIDNVDVYTITNNLAKNNTKIYSLSLPFTIMNIGDYAFYGCSNILNELKIPEYVKNIGSYAFANCSNIKGNITIPESIESIGEYAFANCVGLNGYVSFPQSLKTYTSNMLNGCTNLQYIILNSDIVESSTGNQTAFDNTNNCPIYVPDESVDLYKNILSNYSSRIFSISILNT